MKHKTEKVKSEMVKYWYEKYVFYVNENEFVKMAVLSKTAFGVNEKNEMVKKYKAISTFSEELLVNEMPAVIKARLANDGRIDEKFEIDQEKFNSLLKLSGKELVELNTDTIE